MTRTANGAAQSAPERAINWHSLPYEQDDETGRWPRMLPCADGDELLARLPSGEVVTVTVDRSRGCAFLDHDGEPVEPEAIATPPRGYRSGTQSEASRQAAGRVRLTLRITAEQRRRLGQISEEDGYDMSTIIGCYIDQEWEERAKL